jgi:S-(hydroxymethyl)glutathione dehydrogenase/alcohol dehydrogenase
MHVRCKAALLWEQPGSWTVQDVELDPPRDGEVLVRMIATGLCHSDDHFAKNDIPLPYLPVCAGHEGGGIVEEVGHGVRSLRPGDHIVTTFIPSCGRCRWCSSGMHALCDNGALLFSGQQLDGTFRMHADGKDVAQASMISTFSEWSVMPEWSAIKIPSDVPLTSACLVGCAVPTGWGSAVNVGAVSPGDVVIVIGAGGVGMNAVQGARHASASHIIAVDPIELKRQEATRFGATQTTDTLEEAADLARGLTNGQGADVAIVTIGVTTGDDIGAAVTAIRKAGTVVVTGVGSAHGLASVPVNLLELPMFQKRIQGAIYGATSPPKDIPRLVELYRRGQLLLDELVTRTYRLDEINEAYDDMHAGRNIRGVIEFADSGTSTADR